MLNQATGYQNSNRCVLKKIDLRLIYTLLIYHYRYVVSMQGIAL
jgi:hypothetical protein